jgi:hypothetical protein
LAGRTWSVEEYRNGFQRQESDKELWEGAMNYKYRVEDPRLGRFFSVDPLYAKYPYNSNYAFSENRVSDKIEWEGLESVEYWRGGAKPVVVQWNKLGYKEKEDFLRRYDIEGVFGSDYLPTDKEFIQGNTQEVWRIYELNVDGVIGHSMSQYKNKEDARIGKTKAKYNLSGMIFLTANMSSSLDGSHDCVNMGGELGGEEGLKLFAEGMGHTGNFLSLFPLTKSTGTILSLGSFAINQGLDYKNLSMQDAHLNFGIRLVKTGVGLGVAHITPMEKFKNIGLGRAYKFGTDTFLDKLENQLTNPAVEKKK